MKELIAKLLQIKSRSIDSGIQESQAEVDEEYKKAYLTSVGYSVGKEVQGLKTLNQVSDFAEESIEGNVLIQNNDDLGSSDSKKDEDNTINFEKFERGYVGTPILNANPVWTPDTTTKKTSELATELTGQEYEEGYMVDAVSVGAAIHYTNLLNYLNDEDISVDVESELNAVRVAE